MNPSNKENGGIFSHTQSWAVIAEPCAATAIRRTKIYRAFMPAAQNDIAEIREFEPFAHCQSTHGKHSKKFGAPHPVAQPGTVSWSYYTATQWILGIRPELDVSHRPLASHVSGRALPSRVSSAASGWTSPSATPARRAEA